MGDERALAVRGSIERAAGERSAGDEVAAAERRLRAALEEVTALDLEVEGLSSALDAFSRGYEAALRDPFAELAEAERLVGRLQRLEDGLAALARGDVVEAPSPEPRPARPRRSRRSRGDAAAGERGRASGAAAAARAEEAPAPAPPEIEAAEVALKRLYRRLARLLHPDLAADDAERARLGELMARVNRAYAEGDLTHLEVTAERLGAGEPQGELSPEERLRHLERRTASLARIASSIARERSRLLRSDTHRLAEEARARAAAGGDLVAETRAELAADVSAAHGDALARLGRLEERARALSRARRADMAGIVKRGPTGAQRAFDPLAEGELVRMGAARLERRRATPAARELARALEDAVRDAPWEVALTLAAFFAEDAGGRPPEALARAEALVGTWERIRARYPAAPELPRLLARLPRHLVLGARTQGEGVVAGVQLAAAELLAGVRIALEVPAVAEVARVVLAALGPEERCEGCGAAGPARHLLRTRGLDERHGLACAACGAILRSYWRYGEVDGLEALAPHALRLGLLAEATVQLGDTALGFQMLPAERERLTAGGLLRRFGELYLSAYGVTLPADALALAGAAGRLREGARVASARITVVLAPEAGTTAEELLELLRVRIERRFRP
jgi:hypothetical protein